MSKLRKVICGISGGVDSAVAAALLKKKGFEVVGVFMRNWDIKDETGSCTVDKDLQDAAYVCDVLGIRLHEVNFVKEYWNQVFSEMVRDYQQGITPNPDILCNKYIKFNALFHHAFEKIGCDAVATGHYARTSTGFDLHSLDSQKGVKLLTAMDAVKDQTFFLSQISQFALQKTLFPVGELTKDVVKRLAVELGLAKIAKKKESMGICFIGSRQFQKFIEEYVEPKPGNFIDVESQKIVGKHKGIHYWTLGQRAHIGGLRNAYYIAEKDVQTQNITVASGIDHPALFCQSFVTESPYWICGTPKEVLENHVMIRQFRFQHKHPLIFCTITPSGTNNLKVVLSSPVRAITPGQYAVFYHQDECLGSARILETGPSLYSLNFNKRVFISSEFS